LPGDNRSMSESAMKWSLVLAGGGQAKMGGITQQNMFFPTKSIVLLKILPSIILGLGNLLPRR